MHGFIAAEDRIRRASVHAQSATDTPVFVDDGNASERLDSVFRFQPGFGLTSNRRQPPDTFCATGRALVDAGLVARYGAGIGSTVWVAATGALRLGQQRQNAGRVACHRSYFFRAILFAGARGAGNGPADPALAALERLTAAGGELTWRFCCMRGLAGLASSKGMRTAD